MLILGLQNHLTALRTFIIFVVYQVSDKGLAGVCEGKQR